MQHWSEILQTTMRYKLINNGVQHLTSPLFPCCTNVGSKLKMGKVDSQKRFCSYFHAYIMFMFGGKKTFSPTPPPSGSDAYAWNTTRTSYLNLMKNHNKINPTASYFNSHRFFNVFLLFYLFFPCIFFRFWFVCLIIFSLTIYRYVPKQCRLGFANWFSKNIFV